MSGRRARPVHALAEAFAAIRAAWSVRAWLGVALLAAALAVPLVAGPEDLRALAGGLFILLAAIGLNLAVGFGGMVSLGQGAFMAGGAFGAALLRVDAGWHALPATVAGTAIAAAAGAIVGVAAVRLRGPFVAAATWIVSWIVFFGARSFPGLSGGAQGIPLPEAASPAGSYLLGVGLVAVSLLGTLGLARSPAGATLAAQRDAPGLAEALGVRAARARLGAFVASAAIGGLAGALWVQSSGVADAAVFSPLLSVEVLIAVLIGGAGSVAGPVAGSLALVAIPPLARGLGGAFGVPEVRAEPVATAVLLLVALAIGSRGIVRPRPPSPSPPGRDPGRGGSEPATLEVRGLERRFGGVTALAGVDLSVRSGEVHALIGPNGSGKTTLLSIVAGADAPQGGAVLFEGEPVLGLDPAAMARRGIIRTLQRTEVAEALPTVSHLAIGASIGRPDVGGVRAAFATPRARAAARSVLTRAVAELEGAGLPDGRVADLVGHERRILMMATALAAGPRVLLLDEPSAGMARSETERLASFLRRIRDRGVAVLLVEHDFLLVREIADRVTVLDAGRVLASGTPAEVAADPAVVDAYLG